jgi:hypothetical protein
VDERQLKVEVFVPESHLEAVLDALHEAGAGRIGAYDRVAALTAVQGRWRPLAGADPYAGQVGEEEHGPELKVETRCPEARAADVVAAIRAAHPYEEPVINLLPLAAP